MLSGCTRTMLLIAVVVLCAGQLSAAAKESALSYYRKGVSAKTIGEREQAFEKALQLYLQVYKLREEAGSRNGWLFFNIANCYFNLGQVGEAVYYYRMALRLLPGDEKILANLNTALEKRIDAYDVEIGDMHEKVLFFHYGWGVRRRITALVIASVIASVFLLALIWKPRPQFKYPAAIASAVCLALVWSIAADYYATEHIGVIVQSAEVRQGGGEGFAPITRTPLGEGSSVRVLSHQDGWYRVRLNDSRKGFIPQDSLKVVL